MLLSFLKKDDDREHRPITPPTPPPQLPRRSSADVREELGVARDSLQSITGKLEAARQELAEEQSRFDTAVEKFALGEIQEQPDRGGLQASISTYDALRRIHTATSERIARLASELAEVELSEAIADGRERLPAILAAAGARLAEFERAILSAKAAESALFSLLFDGRTGLKQRFAGDELPREANRARHQLRKRAMEIARKWQFSPRFETDGEYNAAAEDGSYAAYSAAQLLRR